MYLESMRATSLAACSSLFHCRHAAPPVLVSDTLNMFRDLRGANDVVSVPVTSSVRCQHRRRLRRRVPQRDGRDRVR